MRAMPVFYDHGPTRVTDRWLIDGDRRYAIGLLSNLRTTRITRVARSATGARTDASGHVALGIVGLGAVVAAVQLPLPAAAAIAALAVALPVGFAVRHLRRRGHVLLGEYNGRTTWLYRSQDKVEFGKLSRAVARARSYRADRTPSPKEIISA